MLSHKLGPNFNDEQTVLCWSVSIFCVFYTSQIKWYNFVIFVWRCSSFSFWVMTSSSSIIILNIRVVLAAPLFPKWSPQQMEPHIRFGSDFIPHALPDATLLFLLVGTPWGSLYFYPILNRRFFTCKANFLTTFRVFFLYIVLILFLWFLSVTLIMPW